MEQMGQLEINFMNDEVVHDTTLPEFVCNFKRFPRKSWGLCYVLGAVLGTMLETVLGIRDCVGDCVGLHQVGFLCA
jgi:hypothetical protein